MKNSNLPDFPEYIRNLKAKLKSAFQNPLISPPEDWSTGLLDASPFSVFIPSRFGGRGQKVHECLTVLETCSYESLPFSLITGINGALFLQPVSKYAEEQLQEKVFHDFIHHRSLGGLMITEPDFGSDALQMQSRFRKDGDGYHLQGTKHWGGLTGRADYWLLTARGETEDGGLDRSINFFVWDKSLGGIEVEEYYDSLGLDMIPYGRNRIDTHLPSERRLIPEGSGVRMLLDLLHRSRLQFPGMAMGFLKRLLDEARQHVRSRKVGGKSLSSYDQVQDRMAVLQSYYTVSSAMCAYSTGVAGVEKDCSGLALPANAIKSVITDMMQSAAQTVLQLVGAKGYRRDHIAGQALVDSRPFQIFEGSNDILYEQIAETALKSMNRLKETNLYRYLKNSDLTSRASSWMRDSLDFSLKSGLSQRKKVDLGRILGRLISVQMVMTLADRGFRQDLAENCLGIIKRRIQSLLGSFADSRGIQLVEDYEEGSAWLGFIPG
ncbi:acyl-CoA dehydrogenase [Marispirochaeta aestuarii]|uniref:acyl-CoA dehydrogenase family protein n=1 Tax=Marispirochaeta aestuarii TaxID=1963862 RepID=UPI002ABE8B4C|nr:acyl-CoA dehydrogenase [Marispirochaeta aestuarii]